MTNNLIDPNRLNMTSQEPMLANPNIGDTNLVDPNLFETILPPQPSIWPLATAWYILFAIVIMAIITIIIWYAINQKRTKAKKAALKLLDNIDPNLSARERISLAYNIHRQVCLSYYPRHILAKLHSQDWYIFLDRQLELSNTKPLFIQNQTDWQNVLYQNTPIDEKIANALLSNTKKWIGKALPPSKKQIKQAFSKINQPSESQL